MSAGQIVRIPFHGTEVMTVEVDDKTHVILRPALETLGVDYSTQLQKLKRRSWAVMGLCPTQDQHRDMVTVEVQTFLMLLATIDESRVAAEARPLLIAYQKEVAQAIESYWTKGGVINPRATEDQLAAIMSLAERELGLFRLAKGMVDDHWLGLKVQASLARALGEAPEIKHEDRLLTVGEYLAEKNLPSAVLRSMSSVFGKRMKHLYEAKTGRLPGKAPRFVDGTTRPVAVYTEADRPLFDEVYAGVLAVSR